MPLPLPVNTYHLTIRAPVRSDMRNWTALNRSPKVRKFLNGPLRTVANVLWTQLANHVGCVNQPLAIVARSTGEFIGNCGYLVVYNHPYDFEFYLAIRAKFWRNGYAYEVMIKMLEVAFSSLNAHQVIGTLHPDNHASLKLVEKAGFRFSGDHVVSGKDWQNGHPIYKISQDAYKKARKFTGRMLRSPQAI